MAKIWVEICLISARGLTRTSSLWKLQWFAVGWIDPNNKYCTKVDASGNANPTWKTKFSASIDSRFDDLALNVEVYSRDPVFLKERLQGTASIGLKEFLDKHTRNSSDDQPLKHVEQVGSFQLRRKSSNKPQGFVDVSFRISPETDEGSSYQGDEVGIKLRIRNDGINLPSPIGNSENHQHYSPDYYSGGKEPKYPSSGGPGYQPPHTLSPAGASYHHPQTQPPVTYPYAGGFNHQPPPAPYNVGYMPSSSSSMDNYMNMPSSSSSSSGARARPGVAMGLGAGALAAGAVIFGDDFVSGFDLPTGFTISTDPPF